MKRKIGTEMKSGIRSRSLKILVTEPESCHPDLMAILRSIGSVRAEKMDRRKLLEEVRKYDILVVGVETLVDREVIRRARRLKIIASNTTGTDHIDTKFAERRSIRVLTLSDNPKILRKVSATAEHTFALLLSLLRKIPWAFDTVRKGKWKRSEFFGRQIRGKTIGIIGFGRLGRMMARYSRAFGMRVLAYDPYAKHDVKGVSFVSLEELLRNSDIISVHVKLTEETENLIGFDEFKMMTRKPVIINTSRGRVINQRALLYALKKGLISGAALDVIREELTEDPLRKNPLVEYARKHKNLLITPHLGGATEESLRITGVYIGRKIKEVVREMFRERDSTASEPSSICSCPSGRVGEGVSR